jgi:PAS domain S-box-containing protein
MYDITLAHSTKEAEDLLKHRQFKVIVSDISMPGESGLDFFKRIHFEECEPIFIVLTAFISNNLLMEALNQGRIFRYLTKPINKSEVKFTIDLAIQTYDLMAQNFRLNKQIVESERNFQNIFQSTQDGIVIIGMDDRIMLTNHAFLNMTKNDLSEIIPDYYNDVKTLNKDKSHINEYYFYTSDFQYKYVEANSKLIDYQGSTAILSILRDITERKLSEQRILNAVINAEESERSRIAKDLHDGLGPLMATLKMYLEWFTDKKKIENNPDVVQLSLSTVNEAIVTLKNISNNLSPHILEKFGLVSALTSFIEKIRKVAPIQISFNPMYKERFNLIAEISLYRILTECINNSLKHSHAKNIQIVISLNTKHIVANYEDDGIGFDAKKILSQNRGLGLVNMQNRIKTLGGKLIIQSAPNQGTHITAEIPDNTK